LRSPPPGVAKTTLARTLGVARSTLYYVSRKEKTDWALKTKIEEVLRKRESRAYGSRRLAWELNVNRKRMQRIMRKFGIRPYRRRGRKWRKKKAILVDYPNLLHFTVPAYPAHIWAADFTEVRWHKKKVYVATVIDVFTKEIVGAAVSLRKGAQLTLQALHAALFSHARPVIFHSDNGTDYNAKVYVGALMELGIAISRIHPGCPWENGYQESFYDKFKVELGDPNRFPYLGALVAEIYRVIWDYNHARIHSVLRMPPLTFTKQWEEQKTASPAA
jgi:transposase InsO family protein